MSMGLTRIGRGRARGEEESVLPLINVVFLLLIFFMLTGTLAASDPFEIAPPRSASEGTSGARDMIILVNADGRLALDGVVMEPPTLSDAVGERIAEGSVSRTQLKADASAEAAHIVQVMELLRDAGVDRLQLLTLPEGR